jgi:mycothiol system anti-sigma-R factor
MRIPCEHVVEKLWDYLDDEIDDPVTQRRIEAHLEICARCFPEYDYRRAFLALVERHADDPIPPGLRRSVFEKLVGVDAGEG